MFTILGGLALWIPAFIGWGFRLAPGHAFFGEAGLLGILTTTILACWFNFFLPLESSFSVCFAAVGYFFLISRRREIFKKGNLALVWATGALFFLIAGITYFQEPVYDAGLYHLPMTLWARYSPLPLGLANLNPFLGYNSLWPLLGTAAPIFLTESLVLFFFFLSLFEHGSSEKNVFPVRLFALALLGITLLSGFESGAGSNSTDTPMAVYVLSSALSFLRGSFLFSALFAAFGLTVKLSALPFSFFILLISLWRLREQGTRTLLVCLFLILFGWIVRGVIASGCFAFPSSHSCFYSLSWSVSPSMAAEKVKDIRDSAGNCLDLPSEKRWTCYTTKWVPEQANTRSIQITLLASLIGGILVLFRARKKSRQFERIPRATWTAVLFAFFAGLVFWFFSAPTPRFGLPYLMGVGALLLSKGLGETAVSFSSRKIAYLFCVILVFLVVKRLETLSHSTPLNEPWPRFQTTAVEPDPLSPGTAISVPVRDYRCGMTSPPCRLRAPFGLIEKKRWGRPLFTRNEALQ